MSAGWRQARSCERYNNFFGDDFASRRDLTTYVVAVPIPYTNNKDRSSCSLMFGLQYHNPEYSTIVNLSRSVLEAVELNVELLRS